jgi:6-phosphogluconolactonase (cycloisomerase 2 family)
VTCTNIISTPASSRIGAYLLALNGAKATAATAPEAFIFLTAAFSSSAQTSTTSANTLTPNLLVGTYTKKGSKGIYVLSFDTATGKATEISHTNDANNPSFLTISKDHGQVYAVSEGSDGKVSAYSFADNKLNLVQEKTSKGADPCYVALSPDQTNLLVANYSGGSITSYHRFADGRLSNPQQFIQHSCSTIKSGSQWNQNSPE